MEEIFNEKERDLEGGGSCLSYDSGCGLSSGLWGRDRAAADRI